LEADSNPRKLSVELSSRSIQANEKVVFHIGLLDAANQPARTAKTLPVLLQSRLPDGSVRKLGTIEIPAGQSSGRITASLSRNGLTYVWARNPELLPGGDFVQVHSAPPDTQVRPAPPPSVGTIARPRLRPQITFRYSPDRAFLADGKDAVTVQGFLVGDGADSSRDIRLNVYDSSNSLNPAPLTIPAGAGSGQSILTSNDPGTVTVEFLGSTPPADFQGDKKLRIEFMPPIAGLKLQVSPPDISLVDTADLIVTLADEQGRPIATDKPRQISLSLVSGRGRIERNDLQIATDHFQVRTKFTPEWSGQAGISASTPNLLTVTTPVHVSAPGALLLCSGLGGIVGGLLSRRTRRKSDKWRVPIGLATGFLFYWACIFLGATVAGREVVLNPLSAVALSAIGGWLQTEVFTTVWGVLRPKAKAHV
jgi:hypothetical protein